MNRTDGLASGETSTGSRDDEELPGVLNEVLKRLVPRRRWHADVTRQTLRADLLAGLTGSAIVLPQGVAFATIAGLPPEYGLFAAIVVPFVAAFWGSSRVMVSGPTTAISALMFVTLSGMATPGSADYIPLALTLTFLAGALQLAAGLVGLGALIAFVSHSVIVGFTAAAAVLIAVSQLPGILGITTDGGGGVVERLADISRHFPGVSLAAIGIVGVTLASLVLLERISRRLPSYVIALTVGALAAQIIGPDIHGIAMFQPLRSTFPAWTSPSFDPTVMGALLPGAAAIAFVGLLEAISIGKSFAVRRRDSYDANEEIVGQGLSNLAASFTQSYAGSGSFTRSGVNAESGAQTPLSAVFAAGFLALALAFIGPYAGYVPLPAMAAIILYVAWRLIHWTEIRRILRGEPAETMILGATFLTGIVSKLDFAIFVGVLVSLLVFLKSSARPLVAVGAPTEIAGRRVFRNAVAMRLPQCPQIRAMRIEGPLFFASVEHVEAEFDRIERASGTPQARMLSLKGVGTIDLAGADFLVEQARKARSLGRDLHLIVASSSMLAALRRFHVTEIVDEGNIHSHKSAAIAEMVRRADDDVCAACHLRVFLECRSKPEPPDLDEGRIATLTRPAAAARTRSDVRTCTRGPDVHN